MQAIEGVETPADTESGGIVGYRSSARLDTSRPEEMVVDQALLATENMHSLPRHAKHQLKLV
jgi:hypothetical protein